MARTSRTPGRTQLYNYFELEPGQRLVDLPGYGHATVPRRHPGELGSAGRGACWQRESFTALLLVVDIRRGVGELDLGMLDWAGRPTSTHVLLSKSDKLPRGQSHSRHCVKQAFTGR